MTFYGLAGLSMHCWALQIHSYCVALLATADIARSKTLKAPAENIGILISKENSLFSSTESLKEKSD